MGYHCTFIESAYNGECSLAKALCSFLATRIRVHTSRRIVCDAPLPTPAGRDSFKGADEVI